MLHSLLWSSDFKRCYDFDYSVILTLLRRIIFSLEYTESDLFIPKFPPETESYLENYFGRGSIKELCKDSFLEDSLSAFENVKSLILNVNVNLLPLSFSELIYIYPSNMFTILLQTLRPIPTPHWFESFSDKILPNILKSFTCSCFLIPIPVSITPISSIEFS